MFGTGFCLSWKSRKLNRPPQEPPPLLIWPTLSLFEAPPNCQTFLSNYSWLWPSHTPAIHRRKYDEEPQDLCLPPFARLKSHPLWETRWGTFASAAQPSTAQVSHPLDSLPCATSFVFGGCISFHPLVIPFRSSQILLSMSHHYPTYCNFVILW